MHRRWLSRRVVVPLHLALLVWLPGCLLAFWWQVHRVLGANPLSDRYSVEWPAFALVGVWAWWGLVHTGPDATGQRAQARPQAVGAVSGGPAPPAAPVRHREGEDEELRAHDVRLAELAAREPTTWRSR